jgi:hypothetical protein
MAASLLLTGCLFEGEYGSSGSGRGVSLSKAMEASASGSREPLHGSGSGGSSYGGTRADVVVATGSGSESALPDTWLQDHGVGFPVDAAYLVPFNGEFRSIQKYTLTVCAEGDRANIGIFLAGDAMELKPGTLADSAIKNPWMLEAGVSGRVYFNPAHAFISPYVTANVALQCMFWHYRSPVYVDGNEINADSLPGVGGYAGFGVAFNRSKQWGFFGEAGVGGTVFTDLTGQGFGNDVFDNFGYFSVKVGLDIKF